MRKPVVVVAVAVVALTGVAAYAADAPPSAPSSAITPVKARPADDVGRSVGFNTHWSYYDRVYKRFDDILPKMSDLGVRAIRDGVPFNDDLRTKLQTLCKNGIRLTLSTDARTDLKNLQAFGRSVGGARCIDTVTGINEPDLFWQMNGFTRDNWPQQTRAWQQKLYDTKAINST